MAPGPGGLAWQPAADSHSAGTRLRVSSCLWEGGGSEKIPSSYPQLYKLQREFIWHNWCVPEKLILNQFLLIKFYSPPTKFQSYSASFSHWFSSDGTQFLLLPFTSSLPLKMKWPASNYRTPHFLKLTTAVSGRGSVTVRGAPSWVVGKWMKATLGWTLHPLLEILKMVFISAASRHAIWSRGFMSGPMWDIRLIVTCDRLTCKVINASVQSPC